MKKSLATKSNIIIGVVIVLLLIVIGLQYAAYHSPNGSGSPQGLSGYLSGLARQIGGQPATSTVPAAVASTNGTAGNSTGATSHSSSSAERPYLKLLTPTSGTPGLTIIINGSGFDKSINYISFGSEDAGLHAINGLPANVIAEEGSEDGKTLTFNVPFNSPGGLLCDSTGKNCNAVQGTLLPAGSYPVTVTSRGGTSNTVWFTIVH